MVTLTSRWLMLSGIHYCSCISPLSECIKLLAHFEINTDACPSYLWIRSFKVATSYRNLAPKLAIHRMLRMFWTLLTPTTWIPTFTYMTSYFLGIWIQLHLAFDFSVPPLNSTLSFSLPLYWHTRRHTFLTSTKHLPDNSISNKAMAILNSFVNYDTAIEYSVRVSFFLVIYQRIQSMLCLKVLRVLESWVPGQSRFTSIVLSSCLYLCKSSILHRSIIFDSIK